MFLLMLLLTASLMSLGALAKHVNIPLFAVRIGYPWLRNPKYTETRMHDDNYSWLDSCIQRYPGGDQLQ